MSLPLIMPFSSFGLSHFFFPLGGGGVPEPGKEQICVPWPKALQTLHARRSRHSDVLRGQPAVVLNSSQKFSSEEID